MHIPVKCSCGECQDWAIVELQGSFEIQNAAIVQNLAIGSLCRSSEVLTNHSFLSCHPHRINGNPAMLIVIPGTRITISCTFSCLGLCFSLPGEFLHSCVFRFLSGLHNWINTSENSEVNFSWSNISHNRTPISRLNCGGQHQRCSPSEIVLNLECDLTLSFPARRLDFHILVLFNSFLVTYSGILLFVFLSIILWISGWTSIG